MQPVKVNFLHPEPMQNNKIKPPKPPREPQQQRPWLRGVIVFGVLFIAAFSFGRLSLTSPALSALGSLTDYAIISQFRHLVGAEDKLLKGETDDNIRILLLGMGGESHEGPNLTDTIMVANIRPSTNDVALLSIPRDLVIPLGKHGWQKVNSVNAFGEKEHPGKGADYTRQVMEDILGIDIPYVVRVDFNGFKSLIDSVGGVDIYVERSFSDPTYPTNDFKTQTVSFQKGWQHMNSTTALIYSRSRHGNNGEGTDFARAQRQQKVLLALKDKLLAGDTYRNPATVANTLAALRANISTNLQIGEMVRFAKMAQAMENTTIRNKVLDNSASSPLEDSTLYGAYVLVPKNDDWTPLREIAANIFDVVAPAAQPPENPNAPSTNQQSSTTVEIQNGTPRAGYARDISTLLTQTNIKVIKIGNANNDTYAKTIIEDYTNGANPAAITALQEAVAKAAKLGTNPQVIKKTGNASSRTSTADYLVILGADGN